MLAKTKPSSNYKQQRHLITAAAALCTGVGQPR